jgi:hypothetical protein
MIPILVSLALQAIDHLAPFLVKEQYAPPLSFGGALSGDIILYGRYVTL